MALPSFMKKYIKDSGDASVAEDEKNSGVIRKYLDTGCYAFNALISGSIYKGFPCGKITVVAGRAAAGKTYFAMQAIEAFQNEYPEGIVVYYDSESTISNDMLKDHGIDTSRVIIDEVKTVEEVKDKAAALLSGYKDVPTEERTGLMIVIDSIGRLSTRKEVEDTRKQSDAKDMTKQAALNAMFRVICVPSGQLDVPVFITANVHTAIGTYGAPDKISGGNSVEYAATSIIEFVKKKNYDEKTKTTIGDLITCKTYKSRLTKPANKVEVNLNYTTGLDKYHGLVEMAIAAGVWKKVGTRIEVDGKMLYPVQVSKEGGKYFTKEVLDKIDTYCQNKFCFGGNIDGTFDTEEFQDDVSTEEMKPIID